MTFPVKPHETWLSNYSGKITHRLTPNHQLFAFAQVGRNYQPNRLDGFTLVGITAINRSPDSTTEQLVWGWVWKGEWRAVFKDGVLLEVRAGEYGTSRSDTPKSTADRFEDDATKEVRGGNRDWQQGVRRPQAHGSLSYLKDDWFGNHHFKFGGSAIRNVNTETWRRGYPRDVLHVMANGAPRQVYLFQTPSRSEDGLWVYSAYASDSWQLTNRLTINPGARFDRYRIFLPEQQHFDETFAGVSNVIDWNVIAPRVGAAYKLDGNGRTLVKASYGQYWITPGAAVGANVNPNADEWWRLYQWSDLDGSGAWSLGEELGLPVRLRGGVASESLDPNLKLSFVREIASRVERELPANVGVRTGVVWRGGRQPFLRQNKNRPFEAFTETRSLSDLGPDGQIGTGDDGPGLRVSDIPVRVPPENIVRNVPGADTSHWTWEVTANRRLEGRWSLVAAFAHTWSADHANGYFGQQVRENTYPVTPNDLINTGKNGRHEFTTWSAKIHGTYEAPWNVRIAPFLRHQSGQPFGRTVSAQLNSGRVPILTEPVGTRRMDNVTILDVRIEKRFRLPVGRHVVGFVDAFNVLNANPAQTVIWSSESFLQPVAIVAPRIMRVGMKLEW